MFFYIYKWIKLQYTLVKQLNYFYLQSTFCIKEMMTLRKLCLDFVMQNNISLTGLIEDLVVEIHFCRHQRIFSNTLKKISTIVELFHSRSRSTNNVSLRKIHWLRNIDRKVIIEFGWRWLEK